MLYTQTGTPYYASPEVWQDMPYDGKSDIWSLGCVVFEMIARRPPFKANSMQELFRKVTKADYPKLSAKALGYPVQLTKLVDLILHPNPRMRPSCNMLMSQEIVIFGLHNNYLDNKGEESKEVELNPALLDTIKMPINLTNLNHRLPKANYSSHGDRERLPALSTRSNAKSSRHLEAAGMAVM